MNPRDRKLAARLAAAAALVALMVALPARAEIGAATNPNESSTPVYLASPPDDPDPVPWVCLTSPDPLKPNPWCAAWFASRPPSCRDGERDPAYQGQGCAFARSVPSDRPPREPSSPGPPVPGTR